MKTLFATTVLFLFANPVLYALRTTNPVIIKAPTTAENTTRAELKKVIILDFKNIDQNKNYNYLETSITDAIRNELKAKFDFQELNPRVWRMAAQKNYYQWPNENYTKGFALHLGALLQQDLVVGGYYQAVLTQKAAGESAYVLHAHVFVMDVGKRKVVGEFQMAFDADATLFTRIEEMGTRVTAVAKAVLPNKGATGLTPVEFDEVGANELGLLAGTGVLSIPAAFSGSYDSDKPLYVKDFAMPVSAALFYVRHDFLWPQFMLHTMAGVNFGSGALAIATDTKKINANALDIYAAAHLGYEFTFWRFNAVPLVGGGFSFASVNLDYNTLSALPLTPSGEKRSSAKINASAPFAEGGVKLAFKVTKNIYLHAYALYRQSFYMSTSVGELFTLGGLSMRF